MIGTGEADSVRCQPPRIRLEIDFDLQLDPSRPIQQEQEQYQDDRLDHLFLLQWICNPARRRRGFAFGVRGLHANLTLQML